MAFEFDENKSQSNKIKHGINFLEAQKLWNDVERLEISASNVANLRSVAPRPGAQSGPGEFVPHQVALSSRAGGGVAAKTVPVSPPSVLVFEPGAPDADADGLAARPNVDLATELVNQLDALRNFQANLKVIEAETLSVAGDPGALCLDDSGHGYRNRLVL